MNTILRKQYINLIISIAVCLFAGVVFALVLSKMKTQFDHTNTLKERLASYQINKKAFNEEAVQIRSLQKRLDVLESKVVKNISVPQLLSRLEGLAEANHNKFEITSVQTAVSGDGQKLVIDCTAEGTYEQVQSFFELLQHQEFQIQFERLTIFSDKNAEVAPEVIDPTLPAKPKTTVLPSEPKWKGVATIEIISFQ